MFSYIETVYLLQGELFCLFFINDNLLCKNQVISFYILFDNVDMNFIQKQQEISMYNMSVKSERHIKYGISGSQIVINK